MTTQRFIAEREIRAVSQSGNYTKIHLRVGMPYEVSKDEWACPVSLEGLHKDLRDQHGIDSWQALQLAYQLIAQLLTHFVEDGGKLFWLQDSGELTVSDLLPRCTGT